MVRSGSFLTSIGQFGELASRIVRLFGELASRIVRLFGELASRIIRLFGERASRSASNWGVGFAWW
jgi:hypothetical protein